MDLNYLYFRRQVSQFNADNAGSDNARNAHQVMADAYGVLIDNEKTGREPDWQLPSRSEAADDLRGQAASCRRLAMKARTMSGSEALRAVAHQFDADAERVDPLLAPAARDDVADGDSAALVRVRLALESQSAQWLAPRAGA